MQQKHLILGIVLMIIGIVLYLFAAGQLSDYEIYISLLGKNALLPEMQQQYNTFKACKAVGLILGAGGLLLSIFGIRRN